MTMEIQDKIDLTVYQLDQLKNILNHNLKAVESVNKLYVKTPIITQHLTFFKPNEQYDSVNDSHRDLIIGELIKIIRNIDIFTTRGTILDYYRQLLKEVYYEPQTEETTRLYKSSDIDRVFQYDNNREFMNLWQYMDKYITFKDGTFNLIPDYKSQIAAYYNTQTNNK